MAAKTAKKKATKVRLQYPIHKGDGWYASDDRTSMILYVRGEKAAEVTKRTIGDSYEIEFEFDFERDSLEAAMAMAESVVDLMPVEEEPA
jgi:hypothetical protein